MLREGATDEREYKRLVDSVKASTFTAFYTPPEIIGALASSLSEHGVSPHSFLDPSSGTGNFLTAFQSHLFTATATPEVAAYEKDLLTGRILRQLQPARMSVCKASRSFPRRTTAVRRGGEQHPFRRLNVFLFFSSCPIPYFSLSSPPEN